jgi:hypothetical protein
MTPEEIDHAAGASSREELAAAFGSSNAGDWTQGPNGAEALRAILQRLATSDEPSELARAVFSWVGRSQVTEAGRVSLLGIAIEALAADERLSPGVLAAMLRGNREEEIRRVLDALLSARPQGSPTEAAAVAAEFLVAAGIPADRADSLSAAHAMATWLEKDADAAIEYGATLKTMPMPTLALRQVMAVNPGRGVQLFRKMMDRGGEPYSMGQMAFAAGFSAAQMRDAMAGQPEALKECLPSFAATTFFQARSEMVRLAEVFPAAEVFAHWTRGEMVLTQGAMAIASGLADRDLEAARAWLAPLSAEHRALVLRSAWEFEGLGNPRLAELCVGEPKFFDPESNAFGLIQALAQTRPEVRARALEMAPKEMRDAWDFDMRFWSISREFRGQLPAAMDAVETAPEKLRIRLRSAVLQGFGADYPDQARKWLEVHPEMQGELSGVAAMMPQLSDTERGRIIAASQPRDPVGVRGWLAATSDFATHLAEVNPARGITWLNTLPEEARGRGAMLLAQNWSAYAPGEAAAWAQSLPPGRARSAAAEGMALSVRHHPEQAVEWTMQIQEPETRYQAVKKLVQDWARADLSTAGWISEQGALTYALRAEVERILEQEANRRGDPE